MQAAPGDFGVNKTHSKATNSFNSSQSRSGLLLSHSHMCVQLAIVQILFDFRTASVRLKQLLLTRVRCAFSQKSPGVGGRLTRAHSLFIILRACYMYGRHGDAFKRVLISFDPCKDIFTRVSTQQRMILNIFWDEVKRWIKKVRWQNFHRITSVIYFHVDLQAGVEDGEKAW